VRSRRNNETKEPCSPSTIIAKQAKKVRTSCSLASSAMTSSSSHPHSNTNLLRKVQNLGLCCCLALLVGAASAALSSSEVLVVDQEQVRTYGAYYYYYRTTTRSRQTIHYFSEPREGAREGDFATGDSFFSFLCGVDATIRFLKVEVANVARSTPRCPATAASPSVFFSALCYLRRVILSHTLHCVSPTPL